jgi:hypothetical protein
MGLNPIQGAPTVARLRCVKSATHETPHHEVSIHGIIVNNQERIRA